MRRTHKELRSSEWVLILGAGPVGLELAGETEGEWPHKHVTLVAPADELLPGFAPEMVADLRTQLDALGVEIRIATTLRATPPTEPGRSGAFTVTTTDGAKIVADIWFQAHGATTNSAYLADGKLTELTLQGCVPVTELLTVAGRDGVHDNVYAVGDITDVAEAKMAGYAMQHAEIVVRNITAQLNGEAPSATYQPLRTR
ncbi:FAD-dependent oxidoreductase [Streptodolium elevatio]